MGTEQDFETLKAACEKYRNWGRWGAEDQIGTLNYITPGKIAQATRLGRQGKIFSLAIPFDGNGPQGTGVLNRFNPMCFMTRDGRDTAGGELAGLPKGYGVADNVVLLGTHAATHWDALSHIFWDGKMWNGYDAGLVTSLGAQRNGVETYRDKIVSRGVLLDIPRVKGVDFLEPGTAITPADLEAAERLAKVEVGRGDIMLVRTGHIGLSRTKGAWGTFAGGDAAGLSFSTCGWIFERELAGVASDTWGVEVRPNEINWINNPWHRVVLPNMGLLVGEMFDLDGLAADCARDGVYEFLLVAGTLPLTGSVGSPTNPLAIK